MKNKMLIIQENFCLWTAFLLKGETPGHATPGHATPGWAETPRTDRTGAETPGATPTPGSKRRSRWDETPASQMGGTTPMIGTSGVTPAGPAAMQMQTPTPGQMAMTPEQMQAYRWEREIDERNRYLSDDELDSFFPKEGYKVWVFCSHFGLIRGKKGPFPFLFCFWASQRNRLFLSKFAVNSVEWCGLHLNQSSFGSWSNVSLLLF